MKQPPRFLPRLLALLIVLIFPRPLSAHRLDEYLQATLVTIDQAGFRFQIDLTPGVAVAGQVLSLIDLDHNGVISPNEATAYADLFARDLDARLDGHPVDLSLNALNFPSPAELRTGLGIIQLEFSAASGRLASGPHRLAFANRHLPKASVYLFNAALPRDEALKITAQIRNQNQSAGEIDFTWQAPSRLWLGMTAVALSAIAFATLRRRTKPAPIRHEHKPNTAHPQFP